MIKLLFLNIFIISSTLLFSQKEDHVWISNFWSVDNCEVSDFSEYCGASILDFNQLPPKVYRGEGMTLDFSESNTSLCNSNGELILYTNGQSIHDTTSRWIEGGKRINDSPKWDWLTWDNEFGLSLFLVQTGNLK